MGISRAPGQTAEGLGKNQEIIRVEAPRVPVADTVGAGDSFDAGFLYGYLNGWPLVRCLQAGCVCGSGNVQAAGGTAGQPWQVDFLQQLG